MTHFGPRIEHITLLTASGYRIYTTYVYSVCDHRCTVQHHSKILKTFTQGNQVHGRVQIVESKISKLIR